LHGKETGKEAVDVKAEEEAEKKNLIQKYDEKFLNGKMLVIQGKAGARYAIGLEKPIKSEKEQVDIIAKPINPSETGQRFTFDGRTKSIRLYHKRNFAISIKTGLNTRPHVVARVWKDEVGQKGLTYHGHWMMPYKGQMKLCIEFTKQEPGSVLAWRPCRDTPLQSFRLNQI